MQIKRLAGGRAERIEAVYPEGVPPKECRLSHVRPVWRLENGRPDSGSTAGSFRILSSIGSMPQAIASSSMAHSSAYIPGHSPGARIHDGVGTSSGATRWDVLRFAPA